MSFIYTDMKISDDLVLEVADTGEGADNTVLIVHAFGGPDSIIRRVVDDLRQTFRVISWRSRGMPGSPAGHPSQFTVELLSKDIDAVLDTLGVGDAHLISICSGAPMCVEAIRRAPKRYRSFVGIMPYIPGIGCPTSFNHLLSDLCHKICKDGTYASTGWKILTAGGGDMPVESEPALWLTEQGSNMLRSPSSLEFYAHFWKALQEYKLPADLSFLNTPVLLVNGFDENVCVASFTHATALAERISHARVSLDSRYTHASIAYDSDLIREIRDFLIAN